MKYHSELPDKIISSLLCSAFYGGSSYWCGMESYTTNEHGELDCDGLLDPDKKLRWTITVPEEQPDRVYALDIVEIARGVQTMADKYPVHMAHAMTQRHDSDTGDVFLQCCLFGKILYG